MERVPWRKHVTKLVLAFVAWTSAAIAILLAAPPSPHILLSGCSAIGKTPEWYQECGRRNSEEADRLTAAAADVWWREEELPRLVGIGSGYALILVAVFGEVARRQVRSSLQPPLETDGYPRS
jgi:hypothetical protein